MCNWQLVRGFSGVLVRVLSVKLQLSRLGNTPGVWQAPYTVLRLCCALPTRLVACPALPDSAVGCWATKILQQLISGMWICGHVGDGPECLCATSLSKTLCDWWGNVSVLDNSMWMACSAIYQLGRWGE